VALSESRGRCFKRKVKGLAEVSWDLNLKKVSWDNGKDLEETNLET
jgi:hypothetical protein